MAVTDDMVEAMRALLSGNGEEFRRRNAELDRSTDGKRAYTALVLASFVEAVERSFAPDTPREAIIDYVADVRSRSTDAAENIPPGGAERLIQMVLTDDADISDLDGDTRVRIEMLLIYALISDEGVDDTAIEEFLGKARALADEILG